MAMLGKRTASYRSSKKCPESLCQSVLDVLKDMGIDISNRRGECYENAANMPGVYSGRRACIKLLNPLIEWVPCTAHTRSIWEISVNCWLEMEDFFYFVHFIFFLPNPLCAGRQLSQV